MLREFYSTKTNVECMCLLDTFISQQSRAEATVPSLPAVSLFSGAGLSDIGYEQAGFNFVVQAELDDDRAALCQSNFPNSEVVCGDIVSTYRLIIDKYNKAGVGRLHLLSVTPPCQGMSSSNPGRGKVSKTAERDKRNRLILNSIPIIRALSPRIVVIENVRQILNESLIVDGQAKSLLQVFQAAIQDRYVVFTGLIQTADYGLPQTRQRAIIVAVDKDEDVLAELVAQEKLPWPEQTHSDKLSDTCLPWITVSEWFRHKKYPLLDAKEAISARDTSDALHFVPSYEEQPDRYSWISDIPPNSGKNAYQNACCRICHANDVSEDVAYCSNCGSPMRNRPYVIEKDGTYRLIKGFHSSYRRMSPHKPAPTVTTNTSHLGSDYKIHPWENRVLSIRECCELQSIPRFYSWAWTIDTGHMYVARQVIGEALPPWFTFLHGCILRELLSGTLEGLPLKKHINKARKKKTSKARQKKV